MAWSDAHKLIQQKKFVYIHAAKRTSGKRLMSNE